MTHGDGILIVGGYGVIGRRVAERLAQAFPGRVVIAGRHLDEAQASARELGRGCRARRIDVDDAATVEPALAGVGTVVAAVTQRERHLLEASVEHGVGYTDIAPQLAFWTGRADLAAHARRTGARVILGAGLSPGLSNMMAKKLVLALPRVERIETAIALSVGDEYGPDSLSHVMLSLRQPFRIIERGQARMARAFGAGRSVSFPEPVGSRVAYSFPWSDVVSYPETLGVASAVGLLALDPDWLGRVAHLVTLCGARHLPRVMGRRGALGRLQRVYSARDRFALVVAACDGTQVASMSIAGRRQAEITAAAAAVTARALAAGEIRAPGVWLPEQALDPDEFMTALGRCGWTPAWHEARVAAGGR